MYKEEIYKELDALKIKELIKSELYNSLSMEQRLRYMLSNRRSIVGIAVFMVFAAVYLAIPSFDNQLEQSLKLGSSTRKEFDRFKENGGLESNKESTWKGYRVESISLQYKDDGKLDAFQITLSKSGFGDKPATVASVKSDLSSYCPSNWQSGIRDTYWAKKKDKAICAIDASGSSIGIDINSD